MKVFNTKKLGYKKIFVFDLDGTLTPTKSPMDPQMAKLVADLLAIKKVVIIGGGKYAIFKINFLKQLKTLERFLGNLFLFPTSGTAFYRYQSGWKNVYALQLSKSEKEKIKSAFRKVFKMLGYIPPKKVYGKVMEDRGTQVTFSALGQDVVAMLGKKRGVYLKTKWLRENKSLKMKMTRLLGEFLPELEVRAAGFTSIDVTKKGIDKAYGLRQISKHLNVKIKDMLFVGDTIYPGGNDYAVVKTGVDYISVTGPAQTKKIIRQLLKKERGWL